MPGPPPVFGGSSPCGEALTFTRSAIGDPTAVATIRAAASAMPIMPLPIAAGSFAWSLLATTMPPSYRRSISDQLDHGLSHDGGPQTLPQVNQVN